MIVSAIICLALNVFYEARGASPIDQQAVAAVALNRSVTLYANLNNSVGRHSTVLHNPD
jgi:hypothetical protein